MWQLIYNLHEKKPLVLLYEYSWDCCVNYSEAVCLIWWRFLVQHTQRSSLLQDLSYNGKWHIQYFAFRRMLVFKALPSAISEDSIALLSHELSYGSQTGTQASGESSVDRQTFPDASFLQTEHPNKQRETIISSVSNNLTLSCLLAAWK